MQPQKITDEQLQSDSWSLHHSLATDIQFLQNNAPQQIQNQEDQDNSRNVLQNRSQNNQSSQLQSNSNTSEKDTLKNSPLLQRHERSSNIIEQKLIQAEQALPEENYSEKFISVLPLQGSESQEDENLNKESFRKKLEKNNLEYLKKLEGEFFDKCKKLESPDQFLNEQSTPIDLKQLYEVVSISNVTQGAKYLAVVLKFGTELVSKEDNKYCLQVWNRKGQLVYERVMDFATKNMYMSRDIFIYQIFVPGSTKLFIVKLDAKGGTCCLKLQINQKLSEQVQFGWSKLSSQLLVCEQDSELKTTLYYSNIQPDSFEKALAQPSRILMTQVDIEPIDFSITEKQKVDFTHLKFSQFIDSPVDSSQLPPDALNIAKNLNAMHRQKSKASQVDFKKSYVVQTVILVFENKKTSMQEFYRLISVNFSNCRPKIIALSDTESSLLLKQNDFLNYEGAITDSKHQIVQRNGKKIHFGIARLESGAIQFYYNFRLVEIMSCKKPTALKALKKKMNQIQAVVDGGDSDGPVNAWMQSVHNIVDDKQWMCINIGIDFSNVYYRIAKRTPEGTFKMSTYSSNYLIQPTIEKQLMNQITCGPEHGLNLQETYLKLNESEWSIIEFSRQSMMAQYVKLYTTFVAFSSYMLVGHRNYMSVFRLNTTRPLKCKSQKEQSGTWLKHEKFPDTVRYIFRHNSQPMVQEKHESYSKKGFGVLYGTNNIQFYTVEERKNDTDYLQKNYQIFNYANKRITYYDCNIQVENLFYGLLEPQNQGISRIMIEYGDEYSNFSIRSKALNVAPSNNEFQELCINSQRQRENVRIIKHEHLNDADCSLKLQLKEVIYESGKTQTQAFFESQKGMFQWQLKISKKEKAVHVEYQPSMSTQKRSRIDLVGKFKVNFSEDPEEQREVDIGSSNLKVKKGEKVIHRFNNRNIRGIYHLDTFWLYTLSDTHESYDNQLQREKKLMQKSSLSQKNKDNNPQFDLATTGKLKKAGLYVYDLNKLIAGEIETYKLSEAVAGVNNTIDFSVSQQLVSYLYDFYTIKMCPLAHRNVSHFENMGPAINYLITREERGLFMALDKNLKLEIWSKFSGKLIPLEDEKESDLTFGGKLDQIKDCTVYDGFKGEFVKTKKPHMTYYKNWFNFGDTTYSLVYKQKADKKTDFVERWDDKLTQDLNTTFFEPYQCRHSGHMHGKEIPNWKFYVLKLKHGVVSVEAKFTVKLWKDKSGNMPILWLAKDFETHIQKKSFNILVLSEYDFNVSRMNLVRKENSISDPYSYKMNQIELNTEFAYNLQGSNWCNFLMSPCFERYIGIDYSTQQFFIHDAQTKQQLLIPKGLYNSELEGKHEGLWRKGARKLASRMHLIEKDKLRIITKNGIDITYQLPEFTGKQADVNGSKPQFKILNQHYVTNFREHHFDKKHCFLDQNQIDLPETLDRLVRVNQKVVQFQQEKKNQEFIQKYKHFPDNIYDILFQVEFCEFNGPNRKEARHFLARSFSILDWQIINRILKDDETIDVNSIDTETMISMCFNIIPKDLSNILHYFGQGKTKNTQIIRSFFEAAAAGITEESSGQNQSYHIPYLKDASGLTPLELCLSPEYQKEPLINVATEILENMKRYPTGHFQNNLSVGVILAIQKAVPGINSFLKCRLRERPILNKLSQQANDLFTKRACNRIGTKNYIIDNFQVYDEPANIFGVLFSEVEQQKFKSKWWKEKLPRKEVEFRSLDLYGIQPNGPYGVLFLESLLETDDEEIWNVDVVKMYIEDSYNRVVPFVFWFRIMPVTAWIILHLYWSNVCMVPRQFVDYFFDIPDPENPFEHPDYYGDQVSKVILVLISYSLVLSLVSYLKMYKSSKLDVQRTHLSQILFVVMNVILVALYLKDKTYKTDLVFLIFCAVLSINLWRRFLIVMQLNEEASLYSSMLGETLFGGGYRFASFALLVVILICAFSQAFLQINAALPNDGRFITTFMAAFQYSYFLMLGENGGTSNYSQLTNESIAGLLWLVFIANTILLFVLVVNLFVGVINSAYVESQAKKNVLIFINKAQILHHIMPIANLYRDLFQGKQETDNMNYIVCKEKNIAQKLFKKNDSVPALINKLKGHRREIDQIKEQVNPDQDLSDED